MSIFNPELPKDQGNFMNYSRGIDPPKADTSAGNLLGNVGDLFKDKIVADDKIIKQRVREEVTEGVDRVRGEHGVDAVAKMQAGVVDKPLPEEIAAAGDELDKLTQARRSGRLKDSHYWGRVETIARQVRHRYPGYREHVDNVIADLTGTTPANRIIQELEQEARAGATSEEKAHDYWLKQASQEGVAGDYVQRKQMGKPYSTDELIQVTSLAREKKLKIENIKSDLATRKSTNEVVTTEAKRGFASELHFGFNTMMKSVTSPFGKNYQEFQENVARMRSAGDTRPYSEQEQTQLRQMWATQIRAPALAWARDAAYKDLPGRPGVNWASLIVDGKEVEDVLKGFEKQLQMTEDAMVNKDWGILTANAARTEAIQHSDHLAALLGPDGDFWRSVENLKRMAGPNYVALNILNSSEDLPKMSRAIRDRSIIGMATEGKPIKEAFEDGKKANAGKEYYRTVIKDSLGVLQNPAASPAIVKNTATALFGPKNEGFLGMVSDPHTLYMTMASDPRVIDNIYKTGDRATIENYKNWVTSNFTGVMTSAGNEANNIVLNRRYQQLEYDPKSFSFRIIQTGRPPTIGRDGVPTPVDLAEKFVNEPAAKAAVDKLNLGIQGVVNMIKKDGGDPTETVTKLIENLKIDTSKTKVGPDMETLWDSAVGGLKNFLGAQGKRPSDSTTAPKHIAPLLDFIGKFEAGQGGYDQVLGGRKEGLSRMTLNDVFLHQDVMRKGGSESTAVGKYQFLKATLQGAVRELGLDPATTKFTPEVQDALAMHLLRKRGLNDFLDGKINREQFATNLSKEWASLPHPKTGETNYRGVGSNRALTNLDNVYSVLDKMVGPKVPDAGAAFGAAKQVKTIEEAMALEPGEVFVDPNGIRRIR